MADKSVTTVSHGTIHHLDLTVTNPEASAPFYQCLLEHMGYECRRVYDDGMDFEKGPDQQGFASVGLVRAKDPMAHDRFRPGLHHVAWTAKSREDVDALHQKLVDFGATILDAPADYPAYGKGYYAVFFADPDGLKLEYVYQPFEGTTA